MKPLTATENVKQFNDEKRKAWSNKWFYKIWLLRQKIAVAMRPWAAQRYILRAICGTCSLDFYVEESTSKHLVPAEPLHPASSNRHPAKSRFLTTRRAWLANAILTCHGLATLNGSPPRCRYQFHRRRIGLCWAFYSWSPDRTKTQDLETHSMNTFYLTWCFSLPCLSCLVSSHFSLCPIWTHS